jgi:hypothetical protein
MEEVMKRASIVILLAIGLLVLVFGQQVKAGWDGLPNWTSPDPHFTMSVALADLNNDGYLDLLTGNYKYPYQYTTNPSEITESEFGDYLIAYEGTGTSPYLSSTATLYNSSCDIPARCIDCIAVADYNKDGWPDVAVGAVVGKGNDGGVWVYDNQHGSIGSLFNENHSWHPDPLISFDCHVVRWVDVDCDGDLDLATLGVSDSLRIYLNDYNTQSHSYSLRDDDPITVPLIASSETRELESDTDLAWPIPGTTMEFGDMDRDGNQICSSIAMQCQRCLRILVPTHISQPARRSLLM